MTETPSKIRKTVPPRIEHKPYRGPRRIDDPLTTARYICVTVENAPECPLEPGKLEAIESAGYKYTKETLEKAVQDLDTEYNSGVSPELRAMFDRLDDMPQEKLNIELIKQLTGNDEVFFRLNP
jgi:hypothetical protein